MSKIDWKHSSDKTLLGKKGIVLRAHDPKYLGLVVTVTRTCSDGWLYVDGVPGPGVWIIPRESLLIIN